MSETIQNKREERSDRLKSGIVTLVLSILLLIGLYFYQFSREIVKDEPVTTMLINFGDDSNGDGVQEPINQLGSEASNPDPIVEDPKTEVTPIPTVKEKVVAGTNNRISTPKVEKTETKKVSPTKTSKSPVKTAPTKTATKGDAKGTAAVGNLIRGRGATTSSSGNNGTSGNAGDPLGGSSNGDSRIGVDRKLVSFIPGTMGRGGAQPSHNCSVSGTITIAYTVDKSGNVISARRSSGVSDPCVSTTSVAWVKQYVKAEAGSSSSTGTYRITF